MALQFDTSCLFSTVKNGAGVRRKFGFLPPHGQELDADEEFTVFGDIRQAIIGLERVTERRSILAFEAAVDRGDILILNTPNPILQDVDDDSVKMLQLDSGSLAAVDPCWTVSLP